MSMCEDYPACGHTPTDPCGNEGPSADDYIIAWTRCGMPDEYLFYR